MAAFKIAFALTLGFEGGYSNDPEDSGGETYKGISRRNWPTWKGWKIIDGLKNSPAGFLFSLHTDSRLHYAVQDFYNVNFWGVLNLDHVKNQEIANELFDTAVNCGTAIAAEFLQDALNVLNKNGTLYPDIEVDRRLGTTTIKTLNAHHNPVQVLKVLNVLQGARYINICKGKPKQERFINGWLSRVIFS